MRCDSQKDRFPLATKKINPNAYIRNDVVFYSYISLGKDIPVRKYLKTMSQLTKKNPKNRNHKHKFSFFTVYNIKATLISL